MADRIVPGGTGLADLLDLIFRLEKPGDRDRRRRGRHHADQPAQVAVPPVVRQAKPCRLNQKPRTLKAGDVAAQFRHGGLLKRGRATLPRRNRALRNVAQGARGVTDCLKNWKELSAKDLR